MRSEPLQGTQTPRASEVMIKMLDSLRQNTTGAEKRHDLTSMLKESPQQLQQTRLEERGQKQLGKPVRRFISSPGNRQ